MLIAKEEGATKTYESLKKDYLFLKTFLNVSGVNLTDIDEIKEIRSVPEDETALYGAESHSHCIRNQSHRAGYYKRVRKEDGRGRHFVRKLSPSAVFFSYEPVRISPSHRRPRYL